MAPRPLESKPEFFARLRAVADQAEVQLRFGGHHHTHAVCRAGGGRWTVRRLELAPGAAEAYLNQHGMFMPEHAEMLAQPGAIVLEAETLAELIAKIDGQPWPMVN